MNKKIFEGYLSKDLLKHFPMVINGFDDYFSYAANTTNVESFLHVAGSLCPDFVEIDGSVFLGFNSDLYEKNKGRNPYGNDKKNIEKYVNLVSLSDFFYENTENTTSQLYPGKGNVHLYIEFANILKIFWSKRLNELFPERNLFSKFLKRE